MQATEDAVGAYARQSKCRGTRVSALVNYVHGESVEGDRERKEKGVGTMVEYPDHPGRDVEALWTFRFLWI